MLLGVVTGGALIREGNGTETANDDCFDGHEEEEKELDEDETLVAVVQADPETEAHCLDELKK